MIQNTEHRIYRTEGYLQEKERDACFEISGTVNTEYGICKVYSVLFKGKTHGRIIQGAHVEMIINGRMVRRYFDNHLTPLGLTRKATEFARQSWINYSRKPLPKYMKGLSMTGK